MTDVVVIEQKKMDLRGATVIDGFPSVGLVSSIAANYLIKLLELEQVAVMDSMEFPTVSLVRDSLPLNPVRVYAGKREGENGEVEKIAIFISEFQPPPPLIRPIAKTMIDWAQDQRCSMVISPEGLVIDRESVDETADDQNNVVYGLASNAKNMDLLKQCGVKPFTDGVITGVAGVLLNEGKMRDYDVLSILAEASAEYPDARAASNVVAVIAKILEGIDIDYRPLLEEAERMEDQLKKIREQSKHQARAEKSPPRPSMYG